MQIHRLLFFFMILCASFSQVMADVTVEISPNFVRIPLNKTQIFEIELTGDGKLYEVKAYGVGLDWSTKNSWVGNYGKIEYLSFTPDKIGDYVVTVEVDNIRAATSIIVYDPQEGTTSDLFVRIQNARAQLTTPEEFAKIDEVERLYNESRFELAEIRLSDLLENLSEASVQTSTSMLPNVVLIFLLILSAGVVTKLLF